MSIFRMLLYELQDSMNKLILYENSFLKKVDNLLETKHFKNLSYQY